MEDNKESKRDRHHLEVPVEISMGDVVVDKTEYLKNVSVGGLCFKSRVFIAEKTKIRIKMPLTRPVFKAVGEVAWCREIDDYFEIGIRFIETQDKFKVRMIEQICLIENYKKEIFEKEGRILTGEQAAIEWINIYAKKFREDKWEKED